MRRFIILSLAVLVLGCTSTVTHNQNVVIKHTSDIDKLRPYLADLSKDSFQGLIDALQRAMHNPDRFEFIRTESALREKSTKRPSGTHITYYYLIRIHYRGENAFGALRLAHQDYHLYPDGAIRAIEKK